MAEELYYLLTKMLADILLIPTTNVIDGVYVDNVNGVAGTGAGVGNPQTPSSNLTDALTIMAARKLSRIYLAQSNTDYTMPIATISNVVFIGIGHGGAFSSSSIDLNGCTLGTSVVFRSVNLGGAFTATSPKYLRAFDCGFAQAGGSYGNRYDIYNSLIDQINITDVPPASSNYFYNCYGENAIISGGGGGASSLNLHITNFKGKLTLDGLKNVSGVNIIGGSGKVIVNVTCTSLVLTIVGKDIVVVDNSAGGATITQDTTIADIKAQTDKIAGKMLFSMDFWSVPQISVIVPAGAANQAMPDVVVAALPNGMTVVKATPMFKFRSISNAGAANKLSGAQHIQIQKGGAGGYADAISLIDDQFTIAAAAVDAPGDVVVGDHNVVAKVDGNATYNLQWTNANADVAGLTFKDVQMGIRIWYSV